MLPLPFVSIGEMTMRKRIRLVGAVALFALVLTPELFACGDKFLMAGRGTRYQRPKTARAAAVLIYANPTTGLPSALAQNKIPLDAILKREGHRSTTVGSPAELSSILAAGRFDVVLAASGSVDAVQQAVGAALDAPVIVSLCVNGTKASNCVKMPPREGSILEAVDKAVETRDKNIRRLQTRG
jgi:hypothetical protein